MHLCIETNQLLDLLEQNVTFENNILYIIQHNENIHMYSIYCINYFKVELHIKEKTRPSLRLDKQVEAAKQ